MLLSSVVSALVIIITNISKPWAVHAFVRNINCNNRRNALGNHNNGLNLASIAASTVEETKSTSDSSTTILVPTWEDLSACLPNNTGPTPLVTLYRDTNGWCPFCERVWLALRVKNIPYRETLINLRDKPQWFVDMVPTALVPAVLIHTDVIEKQKQESDDDKKNESNNGSNDDTISCAPPPPMRTMVWESIDIMKELDRAFPEHTPRLVKEEDSEYIKARDVCTAVQKAGFAMLYSSNSNLTQEELRSNLETSLDDFDSYLGRQNNNEGPFLLGDTISGVDIEIIPTLERFRYQFPLLKDIDIVTDATRRPNLKAWYDAMDNTPAYSDRVMGDEYSWTAVASTFLRIFGSSGDDDPSPETKEKILKADAAAAALAGTFMDEDGSDKNSPAAVMEAVSKLVLNHEAVIADSTNADPQSQKEVPRANDTDAADLALRAVAKRLLDGIITSDDDENKGNHVVTIGSTMEAKAEASKALRTVALRLCVPRDMGAPAAAVLRKELYRVASEIETNDNLSL